MMKTYQSIILFRLENLVTDEITRLIAYPGALQVAHFANNRISIVVVKAYYGGPLVGYALSAFKEHMPHIDCRIISNFYVMIN